MSDSPTAPALLDRWNYLTPEESMAELFGSSESADGVKKYLLDFPPKERWKNLPANTLMELTMKLLPLEDLVAWLEVPMVSFRNFITENREARAEMDDGQALGAQVAVDRAMVLTTLTPFSDAERQAVKEQVALYKWIASKYDAGMYGDKKAGLTDMIPAIIVPPALGPGINPQTGGVIDAAKDADDAAQANRPMPTLGDNLGTTFGELRIPRSESARSPKHERL